MALDSLETRSVPAAVNGRKSRDSNGAGQEVADSRFDRRLAKLLDHAAQIFCEKGYEGASMRDLSRATGMSLAGLYHYFSSKEELLYLIQKHTFETIIANLRPRLEASNSSDAEERIRIFIENHLEYSLANKEAMKVLVHEDETLKNEHGTEVRAIKRDYYRICLELLEDFQRARGLQFSGRLAVLSLFGMINWIYTWHNPRVDANAAELARQMSDIFLNGVLNAGKTKPKAARTKS
ncbi:MAG TPA: TetR/AcrR family transcriptional regulator [Candidatus Angelobacter sp.]|nr:TetR/AcrR family transcriptional regulator [Candidatus Angelobacter sp.]